MIFYFPGNVEEFTQNCYCKRVVEIVKITDIQLYNEFKITS